MAYYRSISAIAALMTALSSPVFAQDGTPVHDDSPCALRAVIEGYYDDIARGDFATAYALWGGEGQASGKSYDAFRAGYAETAKVQVFTAPPSEIEGAVGSLYATVPVRLEAETTWGEHQSFAGVYTLRRVNDVEGASPAQLRWHIESAQIKSLR